MMQNIIIALAILQIGTFFGISISALITMAKGSESKKCELERTEPTMLWTVGNLCKFCGETYEIRFFRQDNKGQTLACIFQSDEAKVGLCVPIEDLEGVE